MTANDSKTSEDEHLNSLLEQFKALTDTKQIEREAGQAIKDTQHLVGREDEANEEDSEEDIYDVGGAEVEEYLRKIQSQEPPKNLSGTVNTSSPSPAPAPDTEPTESDETHLALLSALNTPSKQPQGSSASSKSSSTPLDPSYARLMNLSPSRINPDLADLTKPVVEVRTSGRRNDIGKSKKPDDEDPSDWCCICTENAEVICKGCDNDPYCRSCWNEGHGDGPGKEKGHRAEKFQKQ